VRERGREREPLRLRHPAALTHRPVAAEARPPAGLVRLSIGLEDVDDLIADLDAALDARHAAFPRGRGTWIEPARSPAS
jgi:hypothetical protein